MAADLANAEWVPWLKWAFTIIAGIVQGLWMLAAWMWSRSESSGARLQRIDGAESLANKFDALREDVAQIEANQERARKRYSDIEGKNNSVFGSFQSEQAGMRQSIIDLNRAIDRADADRRELWAFMRQSKGRDR